MCSYTAHISDGEDIRGECSSRNWKMQFLPCLRSASTSAARPPPLALGGLGYRCKMVFSPGIYFCLLLLGMRRCSGLSPFRPFSLFIPDSGFHFSSPSPTTQFLAASPSLLPSLPTNFFSLFFRTLRSTPLPKLKDALGAIYAAQNG